MSATSFLSRFMQLYPELRERLRRKLGSQDLADEALNETYLKVRNLGEPDGVRDPRSYLFRMAMNAASDQYRASARLASASEIDEAMASSDPAADPVRTVDAQRTVERLRDAIAELPPRRRLILQAVRIDERSCNDVAVELGLSKRTVETELRQALEHCEQRLSRSGGLDFASGRSHASYH